MATINVIDNLNVFFLVLWLMATFCDDCVKLLQWKMGRFHQKVWYILLLVWHVDSIEKFWYSNERTPTTDIIIKRHKSKKNSQTNPSSHAFYPYFACFSIIYKNDWVLFSPLIVILIWYQYNSFLWIWWCFEITFFTFDFFSRSCSHSSRSPVSIMLNGFCNDTKKWKNKINRKRS